jgi:hypothetical protein
MHGRFDKSGNRGGSAYRKWGIGFLALPAVLASALLALSILQPPATNWIAEIVQAEFGGIGSTPEYAAPAQVPVQLARPTPQMRIIHANRQGAD